MQRISFRFLVVRWTILALSVVSLSAGPSSAADTESAARWSFFGPEGGEVRTLAVGFRETPILHVGLATGGIYNGAAGGLLDAGSSGEVISSLAVDPAEPSIVYAAVGRRDIPVFKSYNGGATWEPRSVGLPVLEGVNVLAIDPLHPRVLFAGTPKGIYRSDDGGRSWSPRNRGLPRFFAGQLLPEIRSVVVDPRKPRHVYAAGDQGFFWSDNGGATWRWDRSSALVTFFDPWLSVDPASPRTLYLGSARGLFRSTDGGRRWREVGRKLAGGSGVQVLAVSSAGDSPCGAVWAVVSAGLFVSFDCAESWAPVAGRGLEGRVTALATDLRDPARLWAGTRLGVFESRDRGATWIRVHLGMRELEMSSLAWGPELPGGLFAGSERHGVFRRPLDGRWKRVPFGESQVVTGPVASASSDSSILYAASYDSVPGVARSTDDGRTWSAATLAEECIVVDSVEVDPETPTTVFAAVQPIGLACFRGCTLYRSTDGAASWSCLPVSAQGGLAIDPLQPNRLWVGALGLPEEGPSVYRSLDGGDSWHWVLSVGRGNRVEALVAGPNVLFAGISDGRVLRSTDGGESWDDVSAGLPEAPITALTLDPLEPDRVYAAWAGEGVFRSSDGGGRWEPLRRGLPAGLTVNSFLFDPPGEVLYAASDEGVYRLEM